MTSIGIDLLLVQAEPNTCCSRQDSAVVSEGNSNVSSELLQFEILLILWSIFPQWFVELFHICGWIFSSSKWLLEMFCFLVLPFHDWGLFSLKCIWICFHLHYNLSCAHCILQLDHCELQSAVLLPSDCVL